MGRPTKLTPERHQQIIEYLRLGLTQEQAALAAGIHPGTLYRWLQRGDDPTAPPIYREFRDALKVARAEAERAYLTIIRSAAEAGTWQAAAWFLERSFPDRWARRDRLTVDVTTAESVIDRELRRLSEQLRAEATGPVPDE